MLNSAGTPAYKANNWQWRVISEHDRDVFLPQLLYTRPPKISPSCMSPCDFGFTFRPRNRITTLRCVVVRKQIGIVQNTDVWFVSLCHWFTDYWLRLLAFCPTLLLAFSSGTGHLSRFPVWLVWQNIIGIIVIFTTIITILAFIIAIVIIRIRIITIIVIIIIICIGFAEDICPVFRPD